MRFDQAKKGLLHLKDLYDQWDLRGFIILSLCLQIVLIIAAPLRKRTSNNYINVPIWIAYLLADYIANYSVGLIAKTQSQRLEPTTTTTGPIQNPNLLAFWAPFLLLHLAGPDTITAYALQDNELWLRHFFQLIFQTAAAGYVFVLTLASGNLLWPPTLLMFVTGFIKYTERTRSLYFASVRRFRESLLHDPNPGPDFAKLMDVYFTMKQANLPSKIEMILEPQKVAVNKLDMIGNQKPMEDLEIIRKAYGFFLTFRGLLSDLIFSFRERNQSRSFFLLRTPREAFKIVEVELNLFYEILYTKVVVIQRPSGYATRLISFLAALSALVLFILEPKSSQHFHPFDVGLTYLLLAGTIVLDVLSFIMLIYSDWTAVAVTKTDRPNFIMKLIRKLLLVKRKRWPNDLMDSPTWFSRFKDVLSFGRRWSQAIPQYNLIYYCLNQRSMIVANLIGFIGITNLLDRLKYVRTKRFNKRLRDFIFHQLQVKSNMAVDLETSKEIYSGRGDWALRFEGCGHLLKYINGVDYDESLISWHIATDLCYYTDKDEDLVENESSREICKYLSNYMLYLLIMQPAMLSGLASIGEIRYRDTCAEALKFFKSKKLLSKLEKEKKIKGDENIKSVPNPTHIKACHNILGVNTEAKPVTVKGDRSKSVLFDACILAKELKELDGRRKWEVMSKVWVEMLCYGACNCRAYTHAAQLSKGGNLITLVWLLMVHLGLGNQFQISEGHARAKLIVGK
ncbi:uncharacterized protein LOC124912188 [Impatiens glandulifera]|uniref:uncharacterized protein LOC124912188 n=1 Tax=Impatiens glandulifera TaxID=253017 RepID=UPI001FB084CE|nr:uncharacterized protein LOC124912188 [Impatiens glandulifera]